MITSDYFPEHNTLWMAFSGAVSIRELAELSAAINALALQAPGKLIGVMDVREVTYHPQSLGELSLAYDMGAPSAFGEVIFVGLTGTLTRFLATAVMHMYRLPYTHVETVEEAVRLVELQASMRGAARAGGVGGAPPQSWSASSSQMTS